MSAIFGVIFFDGRPMPPALLKRMAQTLAHRGPDGSVIWTASGGAAKSDGEINAGLGFRRLITTPEAFNEMPPLRDEPASLVLTADVRLDNRAELRAALHDELPPAADGSTTVGDGALLLAAYKKWGEACPEHLLGDFAFAIWDERRRRLFAARDHFGVKPFYYFHVPGRCFAFATEIKALWCVGEVQPKPNERMIAQTLLMAPLEKVETFYEDVVRLPPCHTLIVDRNGARQRLYWAPDLSRELRFKNDADYVEGFREIFREAVCCRLRSSHRVSSTLSGGLDSSSVACMARTIYRAENTDALPLATFSCIWPSLHQAHPRINEVSWMQAVIDGGDIEANWMHGDTLSPFTDARRMAWHADHPAMAHNSYMELAMWRAAQEQGVRVMLTGMDGDTTVDHGYDDLTEYALRGHWHRLYREASMLRVNIRASLHTRRHLMWYFGFRPIVPRCCLQWFERLRPRVNPFTPSLRALPGTGKSSFIQDDFARRQGVESRLDEMAETSYESRYRKNQRRITHWENIDWAGFTYGLEMLDSMSAAFEVEQRYPFFDRRLIEYCLALPLGQILRDGWTRSILRRAMEGILPPAVQWRPHKADLSANGKLKLVEIDGPLVESVIYEYNVALSSYLDLHAMRTVWERYRADPLAQHAADTRLMIAVALGLWLQDLEPLSAGQSG
ncbi:MAG: asparagine synthase (glutamine-hydrolyzing) [Acidobacteria bacterium]|nr:asparagine synthase (glutamine-hydrolyzing) [Acidobacteriota bacterium]